MSAISPCTYTELADSMAALTKEYHSADFVIDLLHTEGDYGMNAVTLADSLLKRSKALPFNTQRLALLIGQDTQGAAEQTAMFLRRVGRAILVGTPTRGGLMPDVLLYANNEHLTEWYDSLQRCDIPRLTAKRYAETHDVKSRYPSAELLLQDFHDDGVLTTTMNALAQEKGIAENDEAFYYSGFTLMSEIRAELIREVFPESPQVYYKALNIPIQQAIFEAMTALQTEQYRQLLGSSSQK